MLWLTGLPAAGKTTLAGEIAARLRKLGVPVRVLDSGELRQGLNADMGSGDAHREENLRRIAEVARLLLDSGIVVLAAVISPYRSGRERAREIVGADRFVEVFVDAPPEVCRQRDPKGLYARAHAGALANFTGFDAPYEAPVATPPQTGRPPKEGGGEVCSWGQPRRALSRFHTAP